MTLERTIELAMRAGTSAKICDRIGCPETAKALRALEFELLQDFRTWAYGLSTGGSWNDYVSETTAPQHYLTRGRHASN